MNKPIVKQCLGCKRFKDLTLYHPHPKGKLGVQPRCKPCTAEQQRATWTNHDPVEKARQLLKRKLWKYGLTVEQFEALVEEQDNRCAICRQHETNSSNGGAPNALCVDHDHVTGTVRGLLCNDCNISIGRMADDPDRLEAAASYLKRLR